MVCLNIVCHGVFSVSTLSNAYISSLIKDVSLSFEEMLRGGIFTASNLLVLLYMGRKKDDILDNSNREMIHRYILKHPGGSFSELRRNLKISNGSLVYHLNVLEKNLLIRSRKAGNLIRYYDVDINPSELSNYDITDFQLEIVLCIAEAGTVAKSDLRKLLGCSHQTLHYNLRKLVAAEILISIPVGVRRNFTVSTDVDMEKMRMLHSKLPKKERTKTGSDRMDGQGR